MADADASCACFSLCHPEEVRHFFLRLPLVTSPASPWYKYLCSVYHTDFVPLPFDMRSLGAFYLPPDAAWFGQLAIPWGGLQCNSTDGRSTAPRCARAVCESWLNLSEAREAQARAWEVERIAHPLGVKTVKWPMRGAVRRDPNILWPAGGLPLKAWSFAPVPVRPLSDEAVLKEVVLMGDINNAASQGAVGARVKHALGRGTLRRRAEPYILLRFAAVAEERAAPASPWVEVLRYFYRVRVWSLPCPLRCHCLCSLRGTRPRPSSRHTLSSCTEQGRPHDRPAAHPTDAVWPWRSLTRDDCVLGSLAPLAPTRLHAGRSRWHPVRLLVHPAPRALCPRHRHCGARGAAAPVSLEGSRQALVDSGERTRRAQ